MQAGGHPLELDLKIGAAVAVHIAFDQGRVAQPYGVEFARSPVKFRAPMNVNFEGIDGMQGRTSMRSTPTVKSVI